MSGEAGETMLLLAAIMKIHEGHRSHIIKIKQYILKHPVEEGGVKYVWN